MFLTCRASCQHQCGSTHVEESTRRQTEDNCRQAHAESEPEHVTATCREAVGKIRKLFSLKKGVQSFTRGRLTPNTSPAEISGLNATSLNIDILTRAEVGWVCSAVPGAGFEAKRRPGCSDIGRCLGVRGERFGNRHHALKH